MKKIIIVLILFVFATATMAQRQFGAVTWNVNFPTNSDYLTKTSYSGGRVEYRRFLKKNENISIGLALDWATYEQYIPRQTFQKPDGSGAVTGDFVAQAYQVPFMATVHYYFKGGKMVKPYAGIGLGAQYLEQELYYNVYVSDNDNWGFAARPELGALIYPEGHHGWGFLVGAYYGYSTNKTELLDRNSFTNFGLNIGVIFGE